MTVRLSPPPPLRVEVDHARWYRVVERGVIPIRFTPTAAAVDGAVLSVFSDAGAVETRDIPTEGRHFLQPTRSAIAIVVAGRPFRSGEIRERAAKRIECDGRAIDWSARG